MNDAPVELVVAAAENDVIGRAGRLPWTLPMDLRHFKSLTLGRHILMGRKTYESIGKALPDRTNWVLSHDGNFKPRDAHVVRTLRDAQAAAGPQAPLMVIGGAQIYALCLAHASRIHLTLVHAHIEGGDTFFGAWRAPEWREVSRERHEADARHAHSYSFIMLERPREAATSRGSVPAPR